MAEPLDADTLAAMELLWRTATRNANNVLVPRPDFARLLAVARDHARLTAEIAESRLLAEALYGKGIVDPDLHQIVDFLSAEAGDTDG
jgi:hypothetical protein